MKKIKFSYCKTILATLLIVSGSFAHATPSAEGESLETLIQWLISTKQKPQQIICNDFPECPPDFAPKKPAKRAEK